MLIGRAQLGFPAALAADGGAVNVYGGIRKRGISAICAPSATYWR
jgi:hypothetical protein